MVLGKFLTEAGMMKGYNVTWLPAYGAEVRGGTAHSSVIISSDTISNPMVKNPEVAIIMNGPSLDKFEDTIQPGGLLILNTSMCKRSAKRKDIEVIELPLTDEAIKLGNVKVANMIAAGIYEARKNIFGKPCLMETVKKMAKGRERIIPVNLKAVEKGMGFSGQ